MRKPLKKLMKILLSVNTHSHRFTCIWQYQAYILIKEAYNSNTFENSYLKTYTRNKTITSNWQ